MRIRRGRVSDSHPQDEPALDQKRVVQKALELLDEVGYDGLTMRNLAKKLDIKAASLYWHVHDKQDLLDLLAEEICAMMHEPDPTLPWRDRLGALAYEYRRILTSHRDAVLVFVSSGAPSGPNRLRLTEAVLKTLLDAGFDEKESAYAGFLLVDYVTMFVFGDNEYQPADAEDSTETSAPVVQDFISTLPTDQYPSLTALAGYLMQPDTEERFQFGIKTVINGLESRLAGRW